MNPRQQHIIGVLRRADEDWLELWLLAQMSNYNIKVTAANVRELRKKHLVVTRPIYGSISTTEVSLAGPKTH